MTATITEPTTETPAPEAQGDLFDVAPAEKLKEHCGGCKLSYGGNWPRGNRSFDAQTRSILAAAAGMEDSKALSAGKKLYDPKQPQIKKTNDLNNRVSDYWTSMTLPLAQSHEEEARLEGGTRLIRRDQIDQFHQQMLAFKSEASSIEDELNENREDVLASSRAMLGEKFKIEDYPERWSLIFRWGFPSVEVPSYLEKLAPAVYRAEVNAVKLRLEHTVELAMNDFLQQFQGVIGNWVDRLGNKTKVFPPKSSEFARFHNGEIIARLTHRDAPSEVPENKVKVQIRYKPAGSTRNKEEWTELLSQEQYADLRPTTTEEKKTFRDSTIQGMLDFINKFRNLAAAISADEGLVNLVDEVSAHLSGFNDAADAAQELRQSRHLRASTHDLMQRLSTKLESQIVEHTKKRRNVIRKKD